MDFIDDLDQSNISLGDHMRMETDRRNLQRLLIDGKVTPDMLASARIVTIQPSCFCGQGIAFIDGNTPLCPQCHAPGEEVEQ